MVIPRRLPKEMVNLWNHPSVPDHVLTYALVLKKTTYKDRLYWESNRRLIGARKMSTNFTNHPGGIRSPWSKRCQNVCALQYITYPLWSVEESEGDISVFPALLSPASICVCVCVWWAKGCVCVCFYTKSFVYLSLHIYWFCVFACMCAYPPAYEWIFMFWVNVCVVIRDAKSQRTDRCWHQIPDTSVVMIFPPPPVRHTWWNDNNPWRTWRHNTPFLN